MEGYGYHSEVGPIQRLLLKHPRQAFIHQENIASQWKALNYLACPDYDKALQEYTEFVSVLQETVPEIHYLPQDSRVGLDSIYLRDAVLMTDKGAILLNMGKESRAGEPEALGDHLPELGIPVVGTIKAPGRVEGGDVVFFDEKTLAVGQGYRTNAEGIRQLKELTSGFVQEHVVVPLPHWQGSEDVLHLMSFISPVDHDLAVAYSKLLPVPFRQWLLRRGIKLIEVPDEEYSTMACNVLAVAPRRCIMLSGNSITKNLLENEGVDVREYHGEEISRKGAGGATCLTRPLHRSS